MTAAFTVGFIVGKVAGHLNDLYLKKKKILRKAIELPILGQNLDNKLLWVSSGNAIWLLTLSWKNIHDCLRSDWKEV